jgi:hypothetical protein
LEKVRDDWPVKSEEAPALTSTQQRKGKLVLGKIMAIFAHTKAVTVSLNDHRSSIIRNPATFVLRRHGSMSGAQNDLSELT